MMDKNIAVILPSRGLIFAEVLESVENQKQSYVEIHMDYHISHNKTIPDCLNYLVDVAQEHEKASWVPYDYFLFIEEDTVIPPHALDDMLRIAIKNILPCVVTVDYPLYNGASSVWKDKTGKIIFCGFGCTLVDARIFKCMQKPYFRSDMELMMGEGINGDETRWQKTDRKGYGRHDIHFFKTVTDLNFPIFKVEGVEAKHLKLMEPGKELTNNGLHKIGLKADKITKHYTL